MPIYGAMANRNNLIYNSFLALQKLRLFLSVGAFVLMAALVGCDLMRNDSTGGSGSFGRIDGTFSSSSPFLAPSYSFTSGSGITITAKTMTNMEGARATINPVDGTFHLSGLISGLDYFLDFQFSSSIYRARINVPDGQRLIMRDVAFMSSDNLGCDMIYLREKALDDGKILPCHFDKEGLVFKVDNQGNGTFEAIDKAQLKILEMPKLTSQWPNIGAVLNDIVLSISQGAVKTIDTLEELKDPENTALSKNKSPDFQVIYSSAKEAEKITELYQGDPVWVTIDIGNTTNHKYTIFAVLELKDSENKVIKSMSASVSGQSFASGKWIIGTQDLFEKTGYENWKKFNFSGIISCTITVYNETLKTFTTKNKNIVVAKRPSKEDTKEVQL